MLLLVAGCGPSGEKTSSTVGTGVVGGQPTMVRVDPNQSGKATALRIVEIQWGRLVDVYDAEDDDNNPQTPPIRTLVLRDFLISENIISDGTNYLLETSPFTEQTELTILADSDSDDVPPASFESGAERFDRLLEAAIVNLGFITPTGTSSSFLPPFPLVPRNAAISIRFNDLLDHATVGEDTVKVFTGSPATKPFNPRVFADQNHGAFITVNGVSQFHSTRVIVDFTVSEAESTTTTASVNSIGLPASTTNQFTNVLVRVPTRANAATGQFRILRNVAGHGLSFDGNGPNDPTITADVIRAFRSGRSDDDPTNSDPNNGFLLDIDAPRILGSQAVQVVSAPTPLTPDASEGDAPSDRIFLVDFQFSAVSCAQTARPGNILRLRGGSLGDLFAEVTRQSAPPQAGLASDVRVRLLQIPDTADLSVLAAEFLTATSGEFQSIYEPGPGVLANCFFSISPTPVQPPVDLISTQPQIKVRFSEPMSPDTVAPHDSFRIDRVKSGVPGPNTQQSVVGQIGFTPDLREFRFSPVVPLDHLQGTSEELFLTLLGGADGVKDLAGNALADSLPSDIRITVDPSEPTVRSGGILLTFETIDEDGNTSIADPDLLIPEVRGQFLRDLDNGLLLPREVARDARVVDRNVPIVANMTTTGAPIITPLVPLGSRMMTVWRYTEVGFSILDENTTNMDVEGINYAPFGGAVSTDFFDLFEISLSHSAHLPDEWPIPINQGGGGYAQFQFSGLQLKYEDNPLDDPNNVETIVHDRDEGYLLTPSRVFTSSTGSLMMPYPMNRNGEAVEDFDYYTWRDTSILGVGGGKGFGADVKALVSIGALCDAKNATVYETAQVRSIGLPLLMEFKCFRDDLAGGLNGLDTSFALPTHRWPIFRVFSSGGFNEDFAPVPVNPDNETQGNGGINGQTGAGTNGNDNTVMLGQLDLVVRVSRVHTIWFDTLKETGLGTPTYLDPVIEPLPDQQPTGTSILVAFRGTDGFVVPDTGATGNPTPLTYEDSADVANALQYDAYGDPLVNRTVTGDDCPNMGDSDQLVVTKADFEPVYIFKDDSWTDDIQDLNGKRFIQARITFISNTATGFRPSLSTFAIPYRL